MVYTYHEKLCCCQEWSSLSYICVWNPTLFPYQMCVKQNCVHIYPHTSMKAHRIMQMQVSHSINWVMITWGTVPEPTSSQRGYFHYSGVIISERAYRLDCSLNRLFRHRSKKTSKLRVPGLFEGNSPVISGFPSQRAGNAEIVSIWLCYHVTHKLGLYQITFSQTWI